MSYIETVRVEREHYIHESRPNSVCKTMHTKLQMGFATLDYCFT